MRGAPRPHAEERRSAMQAQVLSAADARCDASRSMRGLPPPHPSRRAHARPDLRQRFRTRAPQDEAAQGIPNSRFVAEPFSVIPISRCQTALLVPAAHFLRPGFELRFTHPESRGGRSADPPPIHPHVASGCPRPLQSLSFPLLRRPHGASTLLRVHHLQPG